MTIDPMPFNFGARKVPEFKIKVVFRKGIVSYYEWINPADFDLPYRRQCFYNWCVFIDVKGLLESAMTDIFEHDKALYYAIKESNTAARTVGNYADKLKTIGCYPDFGKRHFRIALYDKDRYGIYDSENPNILIGIMWNRKNSKGEVIFCYDNNLRYFIKDNGLMLNNHDTGKQNKATEDNEQFEVAY